MTEVGWAEHLAQLDFFVKSPVLLGRVLLPGMHWAREPAPFGITVNTVAPGFIPVERHAGVPDEHRVAYLATVDINPREKTGSECETVTQPAAWPLRQRSGSGP